MAYQPKSYRKFVATAATATLVATAFAPFASAHSFKDVETKYNDAVDFLVSKGIQGLADGTFGTQQNIKRVDAAMMLGKALGLDKVTDSPASGFTDVPARAVTIVNTFKAKGITSGKTATTFGANDLITRDELAVWIFKAFDLKAKDGSTNKFTDVADNYKAAVQALVDNGITAGTTETTFGSKNNAKRGDFALFIKRAVDAVAVPAVTGVSAVNEKTLSLTGTGLNNLKAESITLADNEVASITPAADGKSAAVTFKHNFTLDQEQTVKIEQEGTKEFKFTYSLAEIKSVELDAKTFDDDTAGQLLTFKINGQSTTPDADFLRQAGYSVKFIAVDNSNNSAATGFFADGLNTAATSATGLLAGKVKQGSYTVEIQVIKAGTVVVSDKKEITVVDIESSASAINSVRLTNVGAGGFHYNSTTLVTGEVADITRIIGNAAGKSNVALPVSTAVVTSSNPAVISVNGQTLTANVAGTATITVKVGSVTKTLTLTVSNAARTFTKVTPSESTVRVVEGETRKIQVSTLDQYGDPIAVTSADITEDAPKNAAGVALITADDLVTVAASGKTASGYEIKGDTKGNGTLLFKHAATGKVVGQIAVQVTDVDNEKSTKVEYTVGSDTTSNSISVGDKNEYQVSKFNASGFYNGKFSLVDANGTVVAGQLKVVSANQSVAEVVVSGDTFTVEGKKAGKADIHITDANGLTVQKFTVTVAASPTVITKVNFKATGTSIDYVNKVVDITDALDVRPDVTGKDPIVYGVEHNAATIAKVRLGGTSSEPFLYIDTDTTTGVDGRFGGNDIPLGVVTAQVLTGATGTNLAALAGNTIGLNPGSYTTGTADKGQILFRVIVDANGDGNYTNNEAIATSVLNINVK